MTKEVRCVRCPPGGTGKDGSRLLEVWETPVEIGRIFLTKQIDTLTAGKTQSLVDHGAPDPLAATSLPLISGLIAV